MKKQLILAIQPLQHHSLNDFCWKNNIFLRQQLNQILNHTGERLIYIWGNLGCGKTHVLQGFCQTYSNNHQTSIYIPLKILKNYAPNSLDNLAEQSLVAIDDLDSIAGILEWEEALVYLYNQVRDQSDTILIMSNSAPPNNAQLHLADLKSRLGWGLVIQLRELNDEGKIQVIQQQAQQRGFRLTTHVAEFLLHHCERNMHNLHAVLELLDTESLVTQRRITIPFVKYVLTL